jgi:hypothetical protein
VNAVRPDRSLYLALRPLEVASYLRAHGWREVKVYPGKGAAWTNERNGETFEILLPYNPELGDFVLRLSEALDTLALAEQRPASAVWEDLTASGADLVRAAAQRPDAADGTLPLEEGVRLIDNARDLMLAGACAADSPRPVYPAARPRRVTEYLGRLRLGQTRRGSYVVSILVPVPQALRADLFGEIEEPFERQATATLARALVAVQEAAERAATTGRFDAFEAAVPRGVSANLCQALTGMAGLENRVTALQFDFSWSPTRPAAESLPRRVRVTADALPLIGEAGRLLRETSPREDVILRGTVVRLDRRERADGGWITVLSYVDERLRPVRVELEEAEYNLAIQAHQDRAPVRCVGDLTHEGRGLILRNPRRFSLEPLDPVLELDGTGAPHSPQDRV